MQVRRDKLTGDYRIRSFVKTPNIGGKITPDTIIIHYTAGVNADRVVKYFTNPKARASSHLVIGKDGKLTQMAEFDIKTWHAGRSYYGGRRSFNGLSIGIEIDNFGLLTKKDGVYKTWFGEVVPKKDVLKARHRNGGGLLYWEKYTDEQVNTVFDVCEAISKAYNIKFILGHEDVSRGRKTDPGPAFPLEELRNYVFKGIENGVVVTSVLNIRSDNNLDGKKVVENGLPRGTKVEVLKTKGYWYKVKAEIVGWVYKKYVLQDNSDEEYDAEVTANILNIREDASSRAEKIADPLKKGTKLDIIETENNWYKVRTKVEGWVSKKYIKKIRN